MFYLTIVLENYTQDRNLSDLSSDGSAWEEANSSFSTLSAEEIENDEESENENPVEKG